MGRPQATETSDPGFRATVRARSLHDPSGGWVSVLAVVLATLVLDQSSKWLVSEWLGRDAATHRWELAGRYLAFEYVENIGAAFGILAGRTWFLSVLAVVVAGIFVALFHSGIRHDRLLRVALGLIIGGACGNVADRVRMGHVTDFIALGTWPKFNVADSAITVGLMLIAISLSRENREREATPGRSA